MGTVRQRATIADWVWDIGSGRREKTSAFLLGHPEVVILVVILFFFSGACTSNVPQETALETGTPPLASPELAQTISPEANSRSVDANSSMQAARESEPSGTPTEENPGAGKMYIRSPAFESGQPIPRQFTADGQDISPPLTWGNWPEGTQQLALICDDPDAPSPRRPAPEPWVHWVIYQIPPDCTRLSEAIPPQERLNDPSGTAQGKNSWGTVGYRGPAPPRGSGPHRYIFTLYALSQKLELKPGLTKLELLAAIRGHTLATAQLIGTYER